MTAKKIYITEFDLKRLKSLIREAREFSTEDETYLAQLEKELASGKVVDSKDVPPEVITMNTKLKLKDMETGEETVYQLVFPEHADLEDDKLSILAPIGTALLGYKKGDIIEWKVPAGTSHLLVKEILYQPEAAGDFNL